MFCLRSTSCPSPPPLQAFSNASSAGSERKLVMAITSLPDFLARSSSSFWQITTDASEGMSPTAQLVHLIAESPSFIRRALKRVAPSALEPIPASQAKTILLILPATAEAGASGAASPPSLSPWKSGRDLTIGQASRKDTAVAISTPSMPSRVFPFGDISIMEIRLPGDAGATRPKSTRVKKLSAQTLPAITASSRIGRAST